MRREAFVLGLAVAFAAPASAMQLEPGEWQGTETGSENGEAAPPSTFTGCITSADTADLIKRLKSLKDIAGNKCTAMQVQDAGNTLTIKVECGTPERLSIVVDSKVTFENAKHYFGSVKSSVSFAGKTTTSDKAFDSKWIGPCKPQPPAPPEQEEKHD